MKKNKDPKQTDARNSRRQPFKYYYLDDEHRSAVEGGRCYKCNKITDAFCDKCSTWICENHLVKPDSDDYLCFCQKCSK